MLKTNPKIYDINLPMEQLSIYLHWPYCERKCPYCDFNSYKMDKIDHLRWQNAYDKALDESLNHTGQRRISSIYFGGGTPSLMAASTINGILENIYKNHKVESDAEITLEANPTTFEASRFKAFKASGINRLSIGVQSLRADALSFLGRWHTADDARKTLEFAAENFERYSFDLIYARPNQTMAEWQVELAEAIPLAKGHMSLYQLTVEPATPFGRDGIAEAPEDLAAEMYLYTLNTMANAGMAAYEVSNFAAQGQESRHNLSYWRGHDWVGIGPGAHGRYTADNQRIATQDSRYPDGWLKAVEKQNHGRQALTIIPQHEHITEQIMTGLRMAEGIAPNLAKQLDDNRLKTLIEQGLMQQLPNGNMAATPQGWLVLNAMLNWLIN
ncbi:MAG: radical SAM family heme chaperone HemW [Alphaproteobacteria bacterium]